MICTERIARCGVAGVRVAAVRDHDRTVLQIVDEVTRRNRGRERLVLCPDRIVISGRRRHGAVVDRASFGGVLVPFVGPVFDEDSAARGAERHRRRVERHLSAAISGLWDRCAVRGRVAKGCGFSRVASVTGARVGGRIGSHPIGRRVGVSRGVFIGLTETGLGFGAVSGTCVES